MAPLILISILALILILCMVLIVRMILGQTSTSTASSQAMMEQFSKALTDNQASQTAQLGQLLDRHSQETAQVLNAQSDYINRFLNGNPANTENPVTPPDVDNQLEMSDPANWSLAQQLDAMPKAMREQIEREQLEQTELERLSAPSHPIHYDPRVPVIQPGLSSAETASWATEAGGFPPMNGSGTTSVARED
jgi:hypothetical protein